MSIYEIEWSVVEEVSQPKKNPQKTKKKQGTMLIVRVFPGALKIEITN